MSYDLLLDHHDLMVYHYLIKDYEELLKIKEEGKIRDMEKSAFLEALEIKEKEMKA